MTALTEALKDLASPDAYPRPRMAEKDFIRFLLPLVVNIDNIKGLDMSIWLDVAGNAHRQIDVFDASNTVLFSVPPLLARVPTEFPTKERVGVDVSSILHHYGELRRVEHPASADAWFHAAMAPSIINMDDQTTIGYLKSWVDIYTRYEIPLDKLFGGAKVTIDPTYKTPTPEADTATQLTGDFDDL